MKKVFILSLFYLLILNSFAFNSVKELDKTIKSFQVQLLKKPFEISNEYILSYEEFKFLVTKNPKNKPDEVVINKSYESNYLLDIANFRRIFNIEVSPTIESIIAYDTLSYFERKGYDDELKILDICFVLQGTSLIKKESYIKRFKMKFIILNDQIKFLGQASFPSLSQYNFWKLDILSNQYKSILLTKYKGEIFDNTKYRCIPKYENNKWGLVSLDNEPLVPCIYDEIKTFKNNYSLVKKDGKYNLLNNSYKLVFKSNLSKIKFDSNSYFILNDKKQFVEYPFVDKKSIFKAEVSAVEPVAYEPDFYSNEPAKAVVDEETNFKIESIRDNLSEVFSSIYTVINLNTKDTLSKHYKFDFIKKYGKYIYGVKNDSTYLMTPKGEVLFKSNLICNFNEYFVDVLDMQKRLFGLYIPENKLFIKPKYLCVLPTENKYFVVLRSNGKIGYLDKNGIELF